MCLCVYCLFVYFCPFFFFKQKTAYEMRISDWSSDVCSSDLAIEQWSDELLVKPGQVGDITVACPTATDAYFDRDAQTRLAKIPADSTLTPTLPRQPEREQTPSPSLRRGLGSGASAASGSTRRVPRMGDLGYFAPDGVTTSCGLTPPPLFP